MGHVNWNIQNVNSIPTYCGVAYQGVHSLTRSHVIRVCHNICRRNIHNKEENRGSCDQQATRKHPKKIM